MKVTKVFYSLSLALLSWAGSFESGAQVPQLMNYQGRIQVGTNNFDGIGQFKFALVSGSALSHTTYWSNDGTSVNGSQPTAAVALPVSKGLYSVLLGDATRPNMAILPTSAFGSDEVYLRVWFNNGLSGFQQLQPDQRIAAVGYAIMAASVVDGSVTAQKLAAGAVTSDKLAPASVNSIHLGPGAVTTSNIGPNVISRNQIADGSIHPPKVDPEYGLWNRSGPNLSHSGGNVGIGKANPEMRLDVTGLGALALFEGSAPAGTWLGLGNTSVGGNRWWFGSSGSSVSDGVGKLLFRREGDGAAVMALSPQGNLSIAGKMIARDIPSIQFRQGIEPVNYAAHETKTIDEIQMSVPDAGFLHITAMVRVDLGTALGYWYTTFGFYLVDATATPIELTRSGAYLDTLGTGHYFNSAISISWILEVDGPKTIILRTRGISGFNGSAQTRDHNLTAVYIPRRQ